VSDVVRCYLDIRGFGPVKEESVQLVREAVVSSTRAMLGDSRKAA